MEHNTSEISEKEVVNFIITRFDKIKTSKKTSDLVKFHTMNKYLLMAHSQQELKILGNVLGNHKQAALSEVMIEYERHLKLALEIRPTIKKHINVIMHIFGSFGKYLNQQEKELFFKLLLKFKDCKITIGKILSEIEPIIYQFNNTYLASQTYFLLYAHTKPGILFSTLKN